MGVPQLNIKDAETTAMVRELAALTGESQTEVVRKAVRLRLDQERMQMPVKSRAAIMTRLREVSRLGAENKIPDATSDHSFLYDAFGAPI